MTGWILDGIGLALIFTLISLGFTSSVAGVVGIYEAWFKGKEE